MINIQFTGEPPSANTFHKRPLLTNAKILLVKLLQLEFHERDHLS